MTSEESQALTRKYKLLRERILEWCRIKNDLFNGQAGLQFSINSTSEEQRSAMFAGQDERSVRRG